MATPTMPKYHAYTVVKRPPKASGENHDFWLAIGEAVPHADGLGYSIKLHAAPTNGKIVLRPYGKSQEEQRKMIKQAKMHKKKK